MLGFDPKANAENNLKYTPSFLITSEGLPQFQEWHKSVFGK